MSRLAKRTLNLSKRREGSMAYSGGKKVLCDFSRKYASAALLNLSISSFAQTTFPPAEAVAAGEEPVVSEDR
jgi:hypothetical protein